VVIRGLTCVWGLSPWLLWCVILLSLLAVGLVLQGPALGVLWHSFSSSFPVHCCLVIRGRYVMGLLENGVFAKCTSHNK